MNWMQGTMVVIPGVALVIGGAGLVAGIAKRDARLVRRFGGTTARVIAVGLAVDLPLTVLTIWLSFREIRGVVDPGDKATVLSAGISEAMNCTAFALMSFIPAAILAFACRGVGRLLDARASGVTPP